MDDSIIPALSPEWRAELRELLELRVHLEHGQHVERDGVVPDFDELTADITVLETLIVPRVERDLGPELRARLGPTPNAAVDWNRFYAGDNRERDQRARSRAHRNGAMAAVRLVALSALGAPVDLDEVIVKGPGDPLCNELFDNEAHNFRAAQRALHVSRDVRVHPRI